MYDRKCVICGFVKHGGVNAKYLTSEKKRPKKCLEASVFFLDEVYTRTCDLQNINSVFGADLYCHKECINKYLFTYDREIARTDSSAETAFSGRKKAWADVLETVKTGLSKGEEYELSYVRDFMDKYLESENAESRPIVRNREVKIPLTNHFDDQISFLLPKQVNKSVMFFSKTVNLNGVAERIRGSDPIKQCVEQMWLSLLYVDLDINDRFCDAANLKESWDAVTIPDPLLNIFFIIVQFLYE